VPVKRARVGTVKTTESDEVEVPLEGGWQSSDVQQAWTSCVKLIRHTQRSRYSFNLYERKAQLQAPVHDSSAYQVYK